MLLVVETVGGCLLKYVTCYMLRVKNFASLRSRIVMGFIKYERLVIKRVAEKRVTWFELVGFSALQRIASLRSL